MDTVTMERAPDWDGRQGRLLRSARKRLNHTQAVCARELGRLGVEAGQQLVSDWERGKAVPPTESEMAIAEYIGRAGMRLHPVENHPQGENVVDLHLATTEEEADPHPSQPPVAEGELERALLLRLETGPPLSRWDYKAAELLGLGRQRH